MFDTPAQAHYFPSSSLSFSNPKNWEQQRRAQREAVHSPPLQAAEHLDPAVTKIMVGLGHHQQFFYLEEVL